MNRTSRRTAVAVASLFSLVVSIAPAAAPGAAAAAAGTMAVDWHRHATEALFNPTTAAVPGAGQGPTVGGIHQAMVQLAVYDAVNRIAGRHQPYLDGLPAAPADASQAAATAVAAHHVLVGLRPALPAPVVARLDGLLANSLAAIPNGSAKDAGVAIGAAAASGILAERANDGRFGSFRFAVGTAPGEWRPTPPTFVNDPAGWVARVRPFTLRATSQFRTEGPLDLTSAEYAAEFNEVKAMGSATSTARTAAQTATAMFYTENPWTLYGRTFRAMAAARNLTLADASRLFAMTTVAGADALIGCWDDKAHWNFWRPSTAIAEAANDGNPATTAQAGWTPLVANPPYPDHPSGYNCATAGKMTAAREFFRTDRTSFVVTNAAGTGRAYTRFSDVVRDTIDARIWLGIHSRTPDEQGAWLGKKVGQWVGQRFFEPLR